MLVLLPFMVLYFSTNHFIALAQASTISHLNQWVTNLVEEKEQQSEKIKSRSVKCSLEMGWRQLLPLFKAPYLTTALLMLAIEFLAMMRVWGGREQSERHCGRALYLSSLGATAQTEEDVRKGEAPAIVPKPDRCVAFAVDCTFPLPVNKINSNAKVEATIWDIDGLIEKLHDIVVINLKGNSSSFEDDGGGADLGVVPLSD
uniref:Uncharacterized protein n=1 Tax=Timema douglasi TaxID=61478 RepID=A0A7R8ZAJ5_TIMDO|nr:unnamed protein product [Timema douglasi]